MRSDADTVERYLAELPEDRRAAISEAIERTPVDALIGAYERSRQRA